MSNVLNTEYVFPTADLLNGHPPKSAYTLEEATEIANKIIVEMAKNGLTVALAENGIAVGSSITKYDFIPDPVESVKMQIACLEQVAELITSRPVRATLNTVDCAITAEIPNATASVVSFKELVQSENFKNSESNTAVCIGRTAEGETVVADIANMPHALIAGNTRSGKSVSVSAMLLSLIWRSSPEQIKLILMDPKRVEFTVYKDLPHLAMPIVEDTKTAIDALNWVVEEMNRRYQLFEDNRVRNLSEYAKKTESVADAEKLPNIIIMIDELAEYMMTDAASIEPLICTVTAKGRAVGVHLIAATQRPSKDVVTGIIKSNLPTKIAMRVAAKTDAITVGAEGADKLVGNGDMLYVAPGAHPLRVHGAFVSGEEIKRTVQFVTEKNGTAKGLK